MTHKLTRALLAAALTSLAAAPAAHAGWMTGNQNPPVYTDDDACRNGIHWSYGTFIRGSWPPAAPSLDLHFHTIWIDVGAPNPSLIVSAVNTRTIPRRLLTLPPSFTMIPAVTYLPGRANKFDYSADFNIAFNRTLPPWTPLRMQWFEPNGTVLLADAHYRVSNCWLGTVRSYREISVATRDPELVVAQLKPRKWYLDEAGIVLVYDADLRHKVGESVALEPGEE